MALHFLLLKQGDEDEGSSLQGEVNRTTSGCLPEARENREISGSPPDMITII
jgi:hypothetical protein